MYVYIYKCTLSCFSCFYFCLINAYHIWILCSIPVVPVECTSSGYACDCFYDLENRANVFKCESPALTTLPQTVPKFTNWLMMKNNGIKVLNVSYPYFKTIDYLNLRGGMIKQISDLLIRQLNKTLNIPMIDLAENKLMSIPTTMRELGNLKNIWLGNNPFVCNCEMTWMIRWLNDFQTDLGEHVVVDYKDIKCHSGTMLGEPIHKLREVKMGCFPFKWTKWQKVGVGIGAGMALLIVCFTLIITTKTREIKFYMYYYLKLDTVPKDDKNENVEDKEYDAFFCYRSDLNPEVE